MSTSGLESRYLARFSGLKRQTVESLKNADSARNVAEHLTVARASLKAQEQNIKELFTTAQEMIVGVDTCQQMFGHTFVKNMPLPNSAIKESPSKQFGYVQLCLRFFQTGVVYFMEQMKEAEDRIQSLESLLSGIADFDQEVDIMGELHHLDLEQLDDKPTAVTQAPEQQKPIQATSITTPPATPTFDEKKSKKEKSSTKPKK